MSQKNLYISIILLAALFYSNLFLSISFAKPALPSVPHLNLYVTGQIGYADTHLKNKIAFYTKDETWKSLLVSNSGLAGRIALGLQINPYFALETGYLHVINNRSYKKDVGTKLESKLNLQQTTYDLLVKANKPFADYFNIYGKAGLAYLTTTLTNRFTRKSLYEYSFIINQARRKWVPEIGLGVSYNLASNLFLDLSWSHLQPLGANKTSHIDFLAAGFSIYF